MKDNRVGKVTAIDDRLRSHRGNFFHVDKESVVPFAQEAWEDQVAVGTALIPLNWDEWYNALSSLVIPTEIRGVFFVRMVLTISFAGLFHLLKESNSMDEIERAWLQMPLVKARKEENEHCREEECRKLMGNVVAR